MVEDMGRFKSCRYISLIACSYCPYGDKRFPYKGEKMCKSTLFPVGKSSFAF